MKRENLLARVLRALSGKSQERIAEEIGVHPSLIGQIETGQTVTRETLERLAESAGITLPQAWEILERYEVFLRPPRRQGRNAEILLDQLANRLRSTASAAYQRLLSLPPAPTPIPGTPDSQRAEVLWSRLADLSEESRLAVVRAAEEFRSWSLCERVCEESETEASRSLERAAGLARLAQEIAERVPGPEEWRHRVRGYAAAHRANVLRVSGDLKAADAALEEAKRLWRRGTDPASVLDPGRILDLEASLRRDQRRLEEALALLDEALAIGRSPARVLIKKAFTLEVMGDYGRAVETLLQAAPQVEGLGDPRLLYMLRFNLAVNFCHLGRYTEAAEHVQTVRKLAGDLGDEVFLIRVLWLEGRIAAALGRPQEAGTLLKEVRRELGLRRLSYDVALVLLEEAVLLLEEGRPAEVKTLAGELAQVFEDKGVHREALAALRLFHEAAEHEGATAELARRVLRFLFRARYDQGLHFV
jgi:tetratricopeptide (TPR) repeat protein